MADIKSEDILIDTIHNLQDALAKHIKKIDAAAASNPADPIINQVERELRELNLETNKIYMNMVAEALEVKETKELIETKKESTSEGG